MKRLMVILTLVCITVFATSAIVAAENGPRWPTETRVLSIGRALQ